ncbi:MAG TPA: hypothetical protein VMF13_12245, partial [Luteitalea sp.]|nr:hypothetical protein [Luteitalea sp.]
FVFAYHGYPAHYFNASIDAVRSVFADYVLLETGVAPFQGPGAALRQVIGTYLDTFRPTDPDAIAFRQALELVLLHGLESYDRHIAAPDRHRTAAGIYIVGLKQREAGDTILPRSLMERWQAEATLQAQFPEPRLVTVDGGLLQWAEAARLPLDVDPGDRFLKRGQEQPVPTAMQAWDWTVMTEPQPAHDAELRRVLVRRQRSLRRKLLDAVASPHAVLALPAKVVRYARWRRMHRAGLAP